MTRASAQIPPPREKFAFSRANLVVYYILYEYHRFAH